MKIDQKMFGLLLTSKVFVFPTGIAHCDYKNLSSHCVGLPCFGIHLFMYWRQILSVLNSKHQQFHFFSHGLMYMWKKWNCWCSELRHLKFDASKLKQKSFRPWSLSNTYGLYNESHHLSSLETVLALWNYNEAQNLHFWFHIYAIDKNGTQPM